MTRAARIEGRGLDWFDRTAGDLQAVFSWPEWIQQHINWADWMRRHANDPSWRQDVIRVPASEDAMHWERWVDWQAGDPRWPIRTIDTSTAPPDQVADVFVDWIEQERRLVRAGHHPLMTWAN